MITSTNIILRSCTWPERGAICLPLQPLGVARCRLPSRPPPYGLQPITSAHMAPVTPGMRLGSGVWLARAALGPPLPPACRNHKLQASHPPGMPCLPVTLSYLCMWLLKCHMPFAACSAPQSSGSRQGSKAQPPRRLAAGCMHRAAQCNLPACGVHCMACIMPGVAGRGGLHGWPCNGGRAAHGYRGAHASQAGAQQRHRWCG